MKNAYWAVIAATLIASAMWLGQADASPIGSTLNRANNSSPTQQTACNYSWNGSNGVNVVATLSSSGASTNIAPTSGCNLTTASHQTQQASTCFNGHSYNQTKVGNAGSRTQADHVHDCIFRGGGAYNMWFVNAL